MCYKKDEGEKIFLVAAVLAVLLVAAEKGAVAHCGLEAALCDDEKRGEHMPSYFSWGLGLMPMMGWGGGMMGAFRGATPAAFRSYYEDGFADLFGQIFPFGASLLVFYLVVVSFLWSLLPVIIIVFLLWWWRNAQRSKGHA